MAQVEDLKILLKVQDAGGTQVIEKLQNSLRGLQRAANKASTSGIDVVAKSVRGFDASGKKNIETLRAQIGAMKALRDQAVIGSTQFKTLTRDIDKYSNALRKAEGRKGGGGRLAGLAKGAGAIAAGGVFGGPEGAIGGAAGLAIGGPAGAAVGAAIGAQLGGIRQALGGTAEYAANLDKLRIALKGVTTSQEEYSRGLSFIQETTERFAVPQEIVTRQFTKLQASVQGAGGNLEDTKTAFNGIVAAVRATGGSLTDVDAALTATAQVFSKGKVSAEELRQQIGERLPGAFTLFAESMGITPRELDKALEQGKVTLEDFQGFAKAIFARYGENAEAIAKGPASAGARLQVQLEKLNESVGRLLRPIGEAFQNFFGSIVKDIVRAADALARFMNLAFDEEKLSKAQAQVTKLTARQDNLPSSASNRLKQSIANQLREARATVARQIRLRDASSIDVQQPTAGTGLGYGGGNDGAGGETAKDITKAQADAQIAVIRLREKGITLTREQIKQTAEQQRAAAELLPPQRRRVELEKIAIQEKNRYTKLEEEQTKAAKKAVAEKNKLMKLELDLNELLTRGGEAAGILSEKEADRLLVQIKVNEAMIKYNALVKEGIIDAEELKKRLEEAFKAIEDGTKDKTFVDSFKDGIESMGNLVENLGATAANAFKGMADQLTDFLITGKANFKDFARSVLADLAQIFIRYAMFQAVKSAFKLTFNAKGNVYGAGSDPASGIVPFARGGIVNKPTLFQYAQGGTGRFGLMGEAGPEAIMPLKRGSDGSLGVVASGSGVGNIVVNVDAGGTAVEGDSQNSNKLGEALGAAVRSELIRQKRPGGLLA